MKRGRETEVIIGLNEEGYRGGWGGRQDSFYERGTNTLTGASGIKGKGVLERGEGGRIRIIRRELIFYNRYTDIY